jgi:hypothetical protein
VPFQPQLQSGIKAAAMATPDKLFSEEAAPVLVTILELAKYQPKLAGESN